MDYFDLKTALITVEQLTQNLELEKVSALGDSNFSDIPENVLTSLYFKEGPRATISSIPSTRDYFGTVLGDDGSIHLKKQRLDLLHKDGTMVNSVAVSPIPLSGSSQALPMIQHALRKGVTVFP